MKTIKQNYGWVIVAILAILPLFIIYSMLDADLPAKLLDSTNTEATDALAMLYHVSGEFAIRWMTAVLTLTPVFIIFGVTNLFVRQAMGIATAVWSLLHFTIFIWAEGFLETFTQVNYIAGFIAILILIPMLLTSNRKSMAILKTNWKKLQSLVYVVIILSILHIILLDKTWLIYGIIVGLGFMVRIPAVKQKFFELRKQRKKRKKAKRIK